MLDTIEHEKAIAAMNAFRDIAVAECDRLTALVEAAYVEGYTDSMLAKASIETCWKNSKAKAAL